MRFVCGTKNETKGENTRQMKAFTPNQKDHPHPMNKHELLIAFRLLEEEVIALFPKIPFDGNGNITSYQHISQHAAANPELINLPRAKPNQYQELLQELERIYDDSNLRIV